MKLLNIATGLILGSLIPFMGTLPAQALTFSSNNSGGGITASNSSDFTFNINAPVGYTTNNVTLTIGSLNHNNLSTLELFLFSPNGAALTLASVSSLSGTNMTNTVLSDAGATSIDTESSPYTGTFQPQGGSGFYFNDTGTAGSFSEAFAGNSPTGTWTLRIYNEDTVAGNLGSVTLNVDTTAVPFEFSPTLGLLLLGGVWGVQHWRKSHS